MQPASLRCRLARFCAAATWLRGHPRVAAAISSSVLLAAALAAKALSDHETADDARAAWSFWAGKDPILQLFAPKSEGGSGAWTFSALVAEGSDSASPLWERWLASLAFDASSPAVLHLRHLGTSAGLDRVLRHAFDALDEQRKGILDLDGLLRFSHGLRGQLHALGDRGHSTPLLDVDWRDAAFLKCSFSTLFPPHSPLSADDFVELAKLLLLRRVVRTLAATRGMASLRRGLASPLVATLELELTGGKRLRLLHTIAPASRPAAVGGAGERLGTLAE